MALTAGSEARQKINLFDAKRDEGFVWPGNGTLPEYPVAPLSADELTSPTDHILSTPTTAQVATSMANDAITKAHLDDPEVVDLALIFQGASLEAIYDVFKHNTYNLSPGQLRALAHRLGLSEEIIEDLIDNELSANDKELGQQQDEYEAELEEEYEIDALPRHRRDHGHGDEERDDRAPDAIAREQASKRVGVTGLYTNAETGWEIYYAEFNATLAGQLPVQQVPATDMATEMRRVAEKTSITPVPATTSQHNSMSDMIAALKDLPKYSFNDFGTGKFGALGSVVASSTEVSVGTGPAVQRT